MKKDSRAGIGQGLDREWTVVGAGITTGLQALIQVIHNFVAVS